jgi:molybdopterin-containing oxidoreductase family iron-sulfur binding subunit
VSFAGSGAQRPARIRRRRESALPVSRRARTIVGIEADFLGTWLSPVEFTRDYASRRRPESAGADVGHIQFESGVSVTGSNADIRVASHSRRRSAAWWRSAARSRAVARFTHRSAADSPDSGSTRARSSCGAGSCGGSRGESLIVCGAGDEATQ